MISRSIHNRNENALTRAEELIAVGQSVNGLQVLYDAIMSKWFQHNLQILDSIMIKFVELCVELRRDRMIKEGLHQYKTLSQNSLGTGLETTIRHFISEANNKFKNALKDYKGSPDQIEDLDTCLMTSSNTGSWFGSLVVNSDTKEKQNFIPWMKFLWDSLKLSIDICRHNSRLEPLYFEIVQTAFDFCTLYNRKSECKKLSDLLHHHLSLIIKYPNQSNGIKLALDSSHELQLTLRFKQIEIVTSFELWQEAFRIIEDIHSLFTVNKRPIKANILMTYYESMSKLFILSENFLFLSFTWYRLFLLHKSQSSPSDQLKKYANLMILSAISIPLITSRGDSCPFFGLSFEEVEIRNQRFSSLLGLSNPGSRDGLFKEINDLGLCSIELDDHVMELYNLVKSASFPSFDLNSSFSSSTSNSSNLVLLEKGKRIKILLSILSTQTDHLYYISAIHRNCSTSLMMEIGRYYSHMTFKFLESLIIPEGIESLKDFSLKWFLLTGCALGEFSIFINMREHFISFNPNFNFNSHSIHSSNANVGSAGMGMGSGMSSMDNFRFDHDHSNTRGSNSNSNSNGIGNEEDSINNLISQIQELAIQVDFKTAQFGKEIINSFHRTLENEQSINQDRMGIMEKKKEFAEAERIKREREDALERQKILLMEQERERIRQSEEVLQREKQKLEQEREEIRKEQMRKKEEHELRLKELQAQRKVQEKIINKVKGLDYLERATRENEKSLLVQDYENQKMADLNGWKERKRLIIEKSKFRHSSDMEMKGRIEEIYSDYQSYLERLKTRRLEEFESMKEAAREEIEKIKRDLEAAREKSLKEETAIREAAEEDRKAKLQLEEDRKAKLQAGQEALREKQRLLDLEAEEMRLRREASRPQSHQTSSMIPSTILNHNNQQQQQQHYSNQENEQAIQKEEIVDGGDRPKKWVPKSLANKVQK